MTSFNRKTIQLKYLPLVICFTVIVQSLSTCGIAENLLAIPTPTETVTAIQIPTETQTPTEIPTPTQTPTPEPTPTPEIETITFVNSKGEEITVPEFKDFDSGIIYIAENAVWLSSNIEEESNNFFQTIHLWTHT